ncbi:hypothetical protein EDB19DRAFT_1827121 [Suillus lakei]|nr:hypothetical protein EDB19DRAFT_1827121 [Suillus lakei]
MPANAPHDLLTTHSLNIMFLKAKEGNVDTSMLDSKQLQALGLAEGLDNFFLTSDPGTGKIFTLSKIIKVLSTRVKLCQLGITASTGATANRLQGKPIKFVFQSLVWDTTFKNNHIRLTTVYHQNEQVGQATKANPSLLFASSGDCSTVLLANQANEDRLGRINGQATICPALDLAQSVDQKQLLLSAPVGLFIKLKVKMNAIAAKWMTDKFGSV